MLRSIRSPQGNRETRRTVLDTTNQNSVYHHLWAALRTLKIMAPATLSISLSRIVQDLSTTDRNNNNSNNIHDLITCSSKTRLDPTFLHLLRQRRSETSHSTPSSLSDPLHTTIIGCLVLLTTMCLRSAVPRTSRSVLPKLQKPFTPRNPR